MNLGNMEGVKEGCEGDVKSEILAGGDWTRCCSPPLTPGMLQPQDKIARASFICSDDLHEKKREHRKAKRKKKETRIRNEN